VKLDENYSQIMRELLAEERPHHRNPDGTTDHEGASRAAVKRIASEYPEFDEYQRSECAVYVNVGRSKGLEQRAKGAATVKANGSSGIPEEERNRDMRMFVYVEGKGYVYITDASIAEVWVEIERRRDHIEADKAGVEELVWVVEIAGRLGANEDDRIGDYIVFK
jgi:hypothetical protein